jgi:cardiolipin synthase (CMP-forming)
MPRSTVAHVADLTAGDRRHRFAMMPATTRLTRSIILHGALFFLAQTAMLLAVTIGYRMGWQRFGLYLAISAGYHAGMTGLLVARRLDFHVEGADAPLTRVNLPNTLTFGRLSSIPTITYLIVKASTYSILPVILPLICVVFATDFLDGKIARKRKEITFVGRYMDSSSDYLMIIAVSIVLYLYDLIPLWFFILIMGRLILFALGMVWLTLREGKANPLATFLGKMSIFALMVLYAMEVARLFEVPWIGDERVVTIIEYIVALIVAVSVVDKAIFLARAFAALPRGKRVSRPGASP